MKLCPASSNIDGLKDKIDWHGVMMILLHGIAAFASSDLESILLAMLWQEVSLHLLVIHLSSSPSSTSNSL